MIHFGPSGTFGAPRQEQEKQLHMSNIKLSTAQKEVIREMRKGKFPIILLTSAFWGGGHGGKINKLTLYSLKKKGIINLQNTLTDLGRSIEL